MFKVILGIIIAMLLCASNDAHATPVDEPHMLVIARSAHSGQALLAVEYTSKARCEAALELIDDELPSTLMVCTIK